MKTIVIGAGPAGLAAAYGLSGESGDVCVFETGNCVGGLARSISIWGQTVDLGPHRFFSKDRRVNELWLALVNRDYSMVKRRTRILYDGKLFKYPLEPFDALGKLGTIEAALCILSYAQQYFKSKRGTAGKDESFQEWVCKRFGQRLFKTFFKTYSEKLWGIPCTELDADFAAQRIKKFSLSAAIKSALFSQNKRQHRTLADEFAYPHGGTGMVYERMAQTIKSRGGQVNLKTRIRKVLVESGKAIGVAFVKDDPHSQSSDAQGAAGGKEEFMPCDNIISTMPLTTLVMSLTNVPPDVVNACKQLKFRNTILVYLEVLNENPFPDNWVYVHSPEFRFGRVTNFRNWVPQICGDSPHAILALEYWCNPEDEMWKQSEVDLIALAKREIVESGLVCGTRSLARGFVFRIPKCYPVYHRGYRDQVGLIRDYLSTVKGIQVIGRYGSFKYNNQDHSILMGLLAAENILAAKHHDLWSVNADYEVYQEACSIKESGLVQEAYC